MNKVFTIVIKAKSTLTQFLCNVTIVSATPLGRRAVDGSGGPAQTPPLGRYRRQKDSSCRVSAWGPGTSAGAALPPEAGGQGNHGRPVYALHTCWTRAPWAAPAGPGSVQYCCGGGGEAAPPGPGSLAQWGTPPFLARPLLGPRPAAWGGGLTSFQGKAAGTDARGAGL